MTGLKARKTLGYVLSVFVRIYAPFVCTICVLVHGIMDVLGLSVSNSTLYALSSVGGYSYVMILYILSTSKRMCKYYKINIYMLLLVLIEGYIYNYTAIDYKQYIQATIITSFIGFVSFLIFIITKGITSHNRKRSQKAVSQTHQAL